MLDLLIFSVFVLLMFLTPLLGIIKYEGLHGIIYRVLEDSDGKIVNVSFKNAGKKSLSLQYVEPEILCKDPLSDVELKQFQILGSECDF